MADALVTNVPVADVPAGKGNAVAPDVPTVAVTPGDGNAAPDATADAADRGADDSDSSAADAVLVADSAVVDAAATPAEATAADATEPGDSAIGVVPPDGPVGVQPMATAPTAHANPVTRSAARLSRATLRAAAYYFSALGR